MVVQSKHYTYVFFAMYTNTHSDQEQKQQPTLCASDDNGTGFLPYNTFLASQMDSHGGRLHSFRHFSNLV
jgi:hypothetical protein